MILTKSAPSLVGTGAFGDVFRVDDATVVKVFRKMRVHDDPIEPTDNDVAIRAVWDSEACAYELAGKDAALARHLVPFHGRCRVTDVLDDAGRSIADRYLLDCGYLMSFVPGRAEKVPHLQDHPLFSEIDQYLDSLSDAGVRSPYDGSVFIPGLSQSFTVIDVATWDAMAELSYELSLHRRLPEWARQRWGSTT